MKRIFGMVAMAVLLVACTACDDGNLIKDPALRACVQAEWDQWAKDKHYDINNKDDLANVFSTFACESKGVKSLEGFEYLVNITDIHLAGNEIEDLSPLAGHKKLTSLAVNSNKISKIDMLKEIENLYSVDLMSNYINDISSLSEVKTLHTLSLYNNCLPDTSQCDALKQSLSELTIYGCEAENQHPERCQ